MGEFLDPSARIGGGTPGQPSATLNSIIEGVEARILVVDPERAEELREGLEKMRTTYEATGRIDQYPEEKELLDNIRETYLGLNGSRR